MKFTDEQRLIVMMLADIQESLNIRGDFDPKFISKVAAWKNEFAIAWASNGIFDDSNTPEEFQFVIDVVDMWSFIERAVGSFSTEERAELEGKAGVWGKNPKFQGFDGNNETDLMSYVTLLVEDLNRFTDFSGRDFNSHVPLTGRYTAMLNKFTPVRSTLLDRRLTVDELAEILLAR